MIVYREANHDDLHFTFKMKTNSTKQLVEKIWGWDDDIQLEYHKNQFDPNKIKIIIDAQQEVGYLSTLMTENVFFIENIVINPIFQGRNIGTKVLLETIKNAVEHKRSIELQVLKINVRAKKLYERLNFQTFEQTDLHYKMRYEENGI